MNVCKVICVRFKATGYKGRHKYEDGQKLCSICAEFLKCSEIRCPCCSVKLRCTPRGNQSRKEIHEKRKAVWH
ncbi:MAG: hypothetical protein OEL69_09575 [Nitrosopumilus sp.]|nr:hypothetical protein [Nitrosopumilus sp.]